jgi:hypothetical protein
LSLASRKIRRHFLAAMLRGLRVVWPILSAILLTMAGLGAVIGTMEGWGLFGGVYFAFVTGLTIGYGDLAPSGPIARVLAIAIGLSGIMLTGLVAAVGVLALQAVTPLRFAMERRPRTSADAAKDATPRTDDNNDRPAHP